MLKRLLNELILNYLPVIDDHLIELDVRILFGNLGSSAQKQTIGQLHDVL